MSNITITGLVATTPRHLITREGLPITSFRVASAGESGTADRVSDGATNWYTVMSFKQLAINTSTSISKGDRIVVSGIVRIRDWDNGNVSGTSVELEASSIGHDLNFGSSVFTRLAHVSNDGTRTDLMQIVPQPEEEDKDTHSCSCNHCGA